MVVCHLPRAAPDPQNQAFPDGALIEEIMAVHEAEAHGFNVPSSSVLRGGLSVKSHVTRRVATGDVRSTLSGGEGNRTPVRMAISRSLYMLIRLFGLDEGLQPAESRSPSVLFDLAFDPVARSASQPGSGIN